jgi:hypothetical protein
LLFAGNAKHRGGVEERDELLGQGFDGGADVLALRGDKRHEDLSEQSASAAGIDRHPRSLVMAMLMQALGGGCDAQGRFDANHCRDARGLKLPACVAEKRLQCGKVQPTAHPIRASDREALASGSEHAACFKLFLQRFALGFRALRAASALPIASARASLERLWNLDVV